MKEVKSNPQLKVPKEFEGSTKTESYVKTARWDKYSLQMLAIVCCVMLFTRLSGNFIFFLPKVISFTVMQGSLSLATTLLISLQVPQPLWIQTWRQ